MRNYLTSMVISAIKPKVSKTSLDKAKSALAKQLQKTKASGAKLKQTLYESQNPKYKGKDYTFKSSNKKTIKESEKKGDK